MDLRKANTFKMTARFSFQFSKIKHGDKLHQIDVFVRKTLNN